VTGLLFVHRLMITIAIVFCAGFCAREIVVAVRGGGWIALALAVASGVGGVVLVLYLRWWLRSKAAPIAGGRLVRDNSPHV
jgi:hypothetical protein